MANIKAKLKRDFPYYGEIKKAGEEILVDVAQVTRLVLRGIIEDPSGEEKKYTPDKEKKNRKQLLNLKKSEVNNG